METEKYKRRYIQNFSGLIVAQLIFGILGQCFLIFTRLGINSNKGTSLDKGYVIVLHLALFIYLIFFQVFSLFNYKYLVESKRTKVSYISRMYISIMSILFKGRSYLARMEVWKVTEILEPIDENLGKPGEQLNRL